MQLGEAFGASEALRAGEGKTLGNLGYLFEAQDQPELAIVFFKQAVNVYPYWQPESLLLTLYQDVLLAGDELARLQNKPFNQLPAEERQRLAELSSRQTELRTSFSEWLNHREVKTALKQLRQSTEGSNLEIEDYRTLQADLANLPQNTVLLYPLILQERLELVLVSPYAPPVRHPVPVTADALNRVIVEFGHRPSTPLVQMPKRLPNNFING